MAALNSNTWTGWSKASGTVPPRTPPTTGISSATVAPTPGVYNFYQPKPLTHVGEGNNTVSLYVTVDTAAMPKDSNGNQWYRIRAAGKTDISGPARISSEKLDNRLRKLSLFTDRLTGLSLAGKGHAQRFIEIIAQPAITTTEGGFGITMQSSIKLSGARVIDSFNSTSSSKSETRLINGQSVSGLYPINNPSYVQDHGNVATLNSTGSNFNSATVRGNVTYSGPPSKNTANVNGTIATPYTGTVPAVSPDPSLTWASGSYTAIPGALASSSPLPAGVYASPKRYKITGDLTVASGAAILQATNAGNNNNFIEIWVTGKLNLPANGGTLVQQPGVNAKIYAYGDIALTGASIDNQTYLAKQLTVYGVVSPAYQSGNLAFTDSNGSFIGVINAPGYAIKITGSPEFSGALIGGSLVINGSTGFHYDESLNTAGVGGTNTVVNYAYASWFEDTR